MVHLQTILLAAALAAAPAEGEVVEQIVAVLRSPPSAPPRPITLTRLREEARVALVGQGALEAATAPLDAPALQAALRWLVDQLLVADEAARLQVGEVAREEVQLALRAFQARFPDEASYQVFLRTADLAEEELTVILARDLKVRRYLESRAGRAQAQIRQLLAELRSRAVVRVLAPELAGGAGR